MAAFKRSSHLTTDLNDKTHKTMKTIVCYPGRDEVRVTHQSRRINNTCGFD